METTDNFMQRLRGFMLFYAAYMQVDHAQHPHGMQAAWAWVARLLNKVPPNRRGTQLHVHFILFQLLMLDGGERLCVIVGHH